MSDVGAMKRSLGFNRSRRSSCSIRIHVKQGAARSAMWWKRSSLNKFGTPAGVIPAFRLYSGQAPVGIHEFVGEHGIRPRVDAGPGSGPGQACTGMTAK